MMTSASLSRLFFVVALAASSAACAVDPNEEPLSPTDGPTEEVSAALAKGGGAATGGACHVISGANTGKSGTYNADGDCEGDWGVSECTNQDGTSSGKCADGAAKTKAPIVTPIFGSSGGVIKRSP